MPSSSTGSSGGASRLGLPLPSRSLGGRIGSSSCAERATRSYTSTTTKRSRAHRLTCQRSGHGDENRRRAHPHEHEEKAPLLLRPGLLSSHRSILVGEQ